MRQKTRPQHGDLLMWHSKTSWENVQKWDQYIYNSSCRASGTSGCEIQPAHRDWLDVHRRKSASCFQSVIFCLLTCNWWCVHLESLLLLHSQNLPQLVSSFHLGFWAHNSPLGENFPFFQLCLSKFCWVPASSWNSSRLPRRHTHSTTECFCSLAMKHHACYVFIHLKLRIEYLMCARPYF